MAISRINNSYTTTRSYSSSVRNSSTSKSNNSVRITSTLTKQSKISASTPSTISRTSINSTYSNKTNSYNRTQTASKNTSVASSRKPNTPEISRSSSSVKSAKNNNSTTKVTISNTAKANSPSVSNSVANGVSAVRSNNSSKKSTKIMTSSNNIVTKAAAPKSSGNFFEEFGKNWESGINLLSNGIWGEGGKVFAGYSKGVVNGLNDLKTAGEEFIRNPIQTTGKAVTQIVKDPLAPVKTVGDFYSNLAISSYYGDWNSVAYTLGGATADVAVIGGGATVAGKIASAIPKTINIPGGTPALATGGGSYAIASEVSTSGAVAAGKAVAGTIAGANIVYAKGGTQNCHITKYARVSDEELNKMYKDPNITKAEKKDIATEQKARRIRHSSKKK